MLFQAHDHVSILSAKKKKKGYRVSSVSGLL